ncbi:MAG: PilZ domain-containing protein [Oscillospiraceae bacterium]|nr:PilZ domain-containing protein [Oscillospiraceae bacterium]
MALVNWHDGYNFGIPQIDSQHETIFNLVKSYEKNLNRSLIPANRSDTAQFLETLIGLLDEHFACEEKLMDELGYPLAEYHNLDHFECKNDLTQILHAVNKKETDGIHGEILDKITDWQLHVEKEDSAFFAFYDKPNREEYMPPDAVGCQCEVFGLNNELITYGRIISVSERGTEIEYRNRAFDISLSEIIKITLFNKEGEFICFMARTTYKDNNRLIVGVGVMIKNANERAHFRVPMNITADVFSDEKGSLYDIKIIDMSIGGLLLESNSALEKGDNVEVSFEISRIKFKLSCKIVRIIKKFNRLCFYGVKFVKLDKASQNNLARCILQEQARSIRKNKEIQQELL